MKSLPKDLKVEIFAKVATSSMFDHCMVKLCCKEFLEAAEDDHVYRHASMENIALVPLPWFRGDKQSWFVKRCRESGNSEIAYREGMVEYFSCSRGELGLKNLKKAALEGHEEAKYVYCMLLMCGEDEGERKKGFQLFSSLNASTSVRRCTKRVKSFIRNMWLNHNYPAPQNHKPSSFCRSPSCNISQNLSTTFSPFLDLDAHSIAISCQYCAADYQLALFRNIIRL
ncbi:hypothetical protein VNO78_22697 [Psophocarpus tetragonolobus]|uniref:F-box domain-containing protein n=1 Tax=Psophocarpus tetragonolobus TaxID=3891 RepID=A0AAN9XDS1_PSOTE